MVPVQPVYITPVLGDSSSICDKKVKKKIVVTENGRTTALYRPTCQ
jgi:hypothetical protein